MDWEEYQAENNKRTQLNRSIFMQKIQQQQLSDVSEEQQRQRKTNDVQANNFTVQFNACPSHFHMIEIRCWKYECLEWWAENVTIVKSDIHGIVATFGGQIIYITSSIAHITAIQRDFDGTLNRYTELSMAGRSRVHWWRESMAK